jgi:hypothetical protein
MNYGKSYIFALSNQCRGNLGGSQHTDFTVISTINGIPSSTDNLSLSIRLGTRQISSLNYLKDDGIPYLLSISQTILYGVVRAVTSKKAYIACSRMVYEALKAYNRSKPNSILLNRNETINDRKLRLNINWSCTLFWGWGCNSFFRLSLLNCAPSS